MVGLKVGFYWYEIGNDDFLYSFFSTIAYNLEDNKWGSRFPAIMNELYQGKLGKKKIGKAMKELTVIQKELKKYKPEKVVWDIEDMSKQPSWGNDISADITDLSNYFVTSDGEDLISVFFDALKEAKEQKEDIEIEEL